MDTFIILNIFLVVQTDSCIIQEEVVIPRYLFI